MKSYTPAEVADLQRRASAKAKRERLEKLLLSRIAAAGLPAPVREYRFHPHRKWPMDFAWPDVKLAVEVQGGQFVNGRHNRPAGYENDCEKAAEAVLLGWRVLWFTGRQVRNGYAVKTIRAALEIAP